MVHAGITVIQTEGAHWLQSVTTDFPLSALVAGDGNSTPLLSRGPSGAIFHIAVNLFVPMDDGKEKMIAFFGFKHPSPFFMDKCSYGQGLSSGSNSTNRKIRRL